MAKTVRYVMQIDANGAPAVSELGKVERSVDDIDDEVDDLESGFDDVGDAAGGIDGRLGPLSGTLGKLAGPAGVAAVATGLFAAAEQAAGIAQQVQFLATTMDLSNEEASKLIAIFDDVGVEADGVLGILDSVTARLSEDEELAQDLGVAFDENITPIDAMKLAIDKWDLLTPTQRVEIFGEEGVVAVGKIIDEGKTLDQLFSEVSANEIITAQDIREAEEFREVVDSIKQLWTDIVRIIGQDVIRSINNLSDPVAYIKSEFQEIGRQLGLINDDQQENIDKMNEYAQAATDARKALEDVEIPIVDGNYRYYGGPYGYGQTVNQTINLGRTATAADVAAASAAWRHANGR